MDTTAVLTPWLHGLGKASGNKNTFNVDDVGYASASDVNMNVGGLNSTLYNQSQTWSNDLVSDNGNYFGDHTPILMETLLQNVLAVLHREH